MTNTPTPLLLENGPPHDGPDKPVSRLAFAGMMCSGLSLTAALAGAQLAPYLLMPLVAPGAGPPPAGRALVGFLMLVTLGPVVPGLLGFALGRAALGRLDAAAGRLRGYGQALMGVTLGVFGVLVAGLAFYANVLAYWTDIALKLRALG